MSTAPEPFTFTPELHLKLDEIVARTGKAPEAVLDEALTSYARRTIDEREHTESFYDAAMRSGLIGCVEGGPPDLATNPKYMEGFGLDGE